ncbi:hypothetical protein LUZ60_015824 [Juncus effusus]|nr:hypothetical protein LUZ60_015824 [Juncus effusus]
MSAQKIETSHQDQVHDAALDYYGKRLATASSDSTVKIHSIATSSSPSQLLATLTGHTGPVWRVSWAHPKFGSILASCGFDGKVVIWKESSPNSNHWSQLQVFTEHKSSVNSVSFAPYELGLCLASGSSDGSISVFSYGSNGTWETSRIERAHPVGVTAVSWAPAVAPGAFSGEFVQKIVSGGFDSCVRVWEMTGGVWQLESVNISQVHKDWVRDVAWAPALGSPKSTIASCSQNGEVAIWTKGGETENWRGRIVKEFEGPIWRVSWGLTGTMLSVSDGEGNVMLWKEGQNGQWEQVTKVEV